MPTTGSGSGSGAGPASASGGSDTLSPTPKKGGSMKIKRSSSSTKVLTKSKSSGSLKKKGESSKSSSKDTRDSASAEMEMLTQKQNGTVGEGDEAEEEQEEKKEQTASIKGMWKKAFKSLKSGTDQKWSAKKGASLKRRDSKEGEEAEPEEPKEIDPVYSLLKCAADLPKVSRSAAKDGQATTPNQGAPCSGLLGRHGDSSGSTSKASSPSSSGLPLTADGHCLNCGAVHYVDTSANLGHNFKDFYRQTSPVKRQSSADIRL